MAVEKIMKSPIPAPFPRRSIARTSTAPCPSIAFTTSSTVRFVLASAAERKQWAQADGISDGESKQSEDVSESGGGGRGARKRLLFLVVLFMLGAILRKIRTMYY